jgi:sulfoxide reductase heme-binding subunit YedZ
VSLDWYVGRAAGVVAYALLTGGVLLGVLLGGRARFRRWPTFAVTDVHRFVAILTGVFLGLHVSAVLLDRVVPFSLAQVLVPGLSGYRPLWVSLGIVAAYLLLAVAVTTRLRKRLGHARWRRWHSLSFGVWGAATLHELGAGTDAGTSWLHLANVFAVASVLAAVGWRVTRGLLGAGAVSR